MPNPKNETRRTSYVIFVPLLFFMLVLEIVHLPAMIAPYRPDFTAILMIYFAITDPKRVNVGIAWLSGIILDFLTGAPLGINALAMSIQVYIIVSQFRHFVAYTIFQQALIIGIINILVHVGVYWLEHLIGQNSYNGNFFLQTLATIVAWPIIYVICSIMWSVFNISSVTAKEDKEL